MKRRALSDVRLGTQALLLQIVVMALTLVVAFGLFAVLRQRWIVHEYGVRALDVARVVAAMPAVRTDVNNYDNHHRENDPPTPIPQLADGPLQSIASEVQRQTDVLFVVITDNQGIRLAHPNPDELGGRVSTDPGSVLAGHEEVLQETGTLGPSVRAKVPILEPNSDRVIGEVSVGISTDAVHTQLWRDVRVASVMGALALLIGVGGSFVLVRRWRAVTLGLRPTEMAELLRGQAAILHGIGEGVLAVDTAWRATFINDEARHLLQVEIQVGQPIEEVGLTARVLDVFKAADSSPVLATVGERVVVVSARPVARNGRDLGTVLVVRDRTDVESLTRQLDAVQLMSTVLRAQRHEFANRLHLLNGLLYSGHVEEASQFLNELLEAGPMGSALPGIDAIRDAYLQAFLAAKASAARERGVTLSVADTTWVSGRLALPVDTTTVLGSLIDNAVDAACMSPDAVKHVEVELLQEGSTLHVTVTDSGTGIAADVVDKLFVEGSSTKPDSGIPGGRGIGLALSRQLARALGGDVWLSSPGDPQARMRGAEFTARLPGVMIGEEAPWATQT